MDGRRILLRIGHNNADLKVFGGSACPIATMNASRHNGVIRVQLVVRSVDIDDGPSHSLIFKLIRKV